MHLSKDLQRTGREGLAGSLAYRHGMPTHSKLGLNSFWNLAVVIDLLALSTLAKIGKKQVYPYQIWKVKWLSWVAFIWIVASELICQKEFDMLAILEGNHNFGITKMGELPRPSNSHPTSGRNYEKTLHPKCSMLPLPPIYASGHKTLC